MTADVYSDPNERPTIPAMRNDIVRAVSARIQELEAAGSEYDLEEVIAKVTEELQ